MASSWHRSRFSHKPKVSRNSLKIVRALDSTFFTRQQTHLEKQQYYIDLASSQFKLWDPLPSPTYDPNLKLKLRKNSTHKKSKNQNKNKKDDDDKKKSSASSDMSKEDGEEGTNSPAPDSTPQSPLKEEKPFTMSDDDDEEDDDGVNAMSRSRTMPLQTSRASISKKLGSINLDRLKNAKLAAEKAMKNKKIFTIQGPYPAIREGLRRRGWVEKFYKMYMAKKSPHTKKKKGEKNAEPTEEGDEDGDVDDDDDDDDDLTDDDDDGCKIPPWEEDNGLYGIMSRVVRNGTPTFIWSVRRDVIDPKALRKDQMINHYGKAGSFTTKIGLCMNLRNALWFEPIDHETFFPRCYRLSHEEEKQNFIDDYHLTACINVLKWIKEKQNEGPGAEEEEEEGKENQDPNASLKSASKTSVSSSSNTVCDNPQCTKSKSGCTGGDKCIHSTSNSSIATDKSNSSGKKVKKKKGGELPVDLLNISLIQCAKYLKHRSHDDIDTASTDDADEVNWDQFLQWYYKLINDGATIPSCESKMSLVEGMLQRLESRWPQLVMDGVRNVWIVKPGAKSRGRGITCYDKLEDMLKLVSSTVRKDGKYVVQKYIERPLLIYNTKFDIRQWFLVTDWNPLTIYFYKDSYVRFCSQQYTLDDFNQAIHLSNNAIQCNYQNGPRSDKLPMENMWNHDELQDYIRDLGGGEAWDELVYPGMKKAVVVALQCSQDVIEYRKSAFELYGADFMLTEDYHPWLIEINCSPSMSPSTKVTEILCKNVLEDTIKVILDRKQDRNCDIGQYELAYRQQAVTVPPYIGISLSVDGAAIKKPGWLVREQEAARKSIDLAGFGSNSQFGAPRLKGRKMVQGKISRSVCLDDISKYPLRSMKMLRATKNPSIIRLHISLHDLAQQR